MDDTNTSSSLLESVEAEPMQWIVYPQETTLIIRKQEYPPIWDIVRQMLADDAQRNHHLLVKGHPGIGKSCMLNYLLWRWFNSDLALSAIPLLFNDKECVGALLFALW